MPDGQVLKLCGLRFTGALHTWGFAIWLASHDGYEDNLLPSGLPAGSPEEVLNCACGLHLGDRTAWLQPLKNQRGAELGVLRVTTDHPASSQVVKTRSDGNARTGCKEAP